MKNINYWIVSALAFNVTITVSLALSTGAAEPAMSAAILLLSTLALGFGAGAHSSRSEVVRLTNLERARRIQAVGHAAERDRMEAEIERLQRQIAISAAHAVLVEKFRAGRKMVGLSHDQAATAPKNRADN